MMNDMEHPIGDFIDWSNDEKDQSIARFMTDKIDEDGDSKNLNFALLVDGDLIRIADAIAAKKMTKAQAWDEFMELCRIVCEDEIRDEIDQYNEA
jgi:hypothetical protein